MEIVDNKVLLSICIPTCNRKDVLVQLVNECLAIPGNEIEVVVSDDVSNDGTEDAMRAIKDNRFRYFRNEKNRGFRNTCESLARGTGKFRLQIRDKDMFLDPANSIPEILNSLREADETTVFRGTLRSDTGDWWMPPLDRRISKGSVEAFMTARGWAFSSAAIVPGDGLEKIIQRSEQMSPYIWSVYPHMLLFAYCVAKGDLIPLESFNLQLRVSNKNLFARTAAWNGTQQEPYWTVASRKQQSIEWIRIIRDFSLTSGTRGELIYNIIVQHLMHWLPLSFRTVAVNSINNMPDVMERQKQKCITEWQYIFWDHFFAMANEATKLYGISFITPNMMSHVMKMYRSFCTLTAQKEGVLIKWS